jgi:hypothetical protein
MAGKCGVVPQQLEDAALERELRYLYATRAETFFHGSQLAPRKHTKRILQLGQEYASRFSDRTRTDSLRPARAPGPGRASRSGGSPRPGPSR